MIDMRMLFRVQMQCFCPIKKPSRCREAVSLLTPPDRLQLPVLYRLLHALNQWYPMAWVWIYISAFVVAICFVFILPVVTLGLLFLAMASLPFSVVGARLLQRAEYTLALQSLRTGRCPNCQRINANGPEAGLWTCRECGAEYAPTGARTDVRMPAG